MLNSSYTDEHLPDISDNWVCAGLIAERRLDTSCSIDDVLCTLELVLQSGQLRSKVQACHEHRQIKSDKWPALQLVVLNWPENWMLEAVCRKTGEPLNGNLYFWGPDSERLQLATTPAETPGIVASVDEYRRANNNCSITKACEALYSEHHHLSASALSQAYYRARRKL